MVGVVFSDTHVTVDTSVLFIPPGTDDVWAWTARVGREFRYLARQLAPPSRSAARWGTWATGAMQKSIYAAITPTGANLLEIEVGVRSPHAMYVLEGTAHQGHRYIYTTLGYANRSAVNSWIKYRQFEFEKGQTGFVMPVTRPPLKTKYLLRVHGQAANPFLTDGYSLLRRRHESLPRMNARHTFRYRAGGV